MTRRAEQAGPQSEQSQGAPQIFSRGVLEKALPSGGCLICSALVWVEWKSIHSFLYEGMMFPHVRGQFMDAGGFCSLHFEIANQIEREAWRAGGIGMAILCEEMIKQGLHTIDRLADESSKKGLRLRSTTGAAQPLRPGAPCMFCETRKEKEYALLEVLEELRDESKFREALENSGLCLWHGQLAVARWKEKASRTWVAELMRNRMHKVADDLQEFIRKHDHMHRAEALGPERDSVARAEELILGTGALRGNQL